jgi:GNAT superfamily N-acetyltransferase
MTRIERTSLDIRRARLEEIVDLRHVMLRQELPREAAIFPGDELPDSRHYGAFLKADAIGCATLHISEWEAEPAWQLRGMAVAQHLLGRGVGKAILTFLENDLLAATPVLHLWCNARVPASAFYLKQGWEIRSKPFDIPTAGPHVKMTKSLLPTRT